MVAAANPMAAAKRTNFPHPQEVSVWTAKVDMSWAMHAELRTFYDSLAEDVNHTTCFEFLQNLKRLKGPCRELWQNTMRGITISWFSAYFSQMYGFKGFGALHWTLRGCRGLKSDPSRMVDINAKKAVGYDVISIRKRVDH